MKIPLRLKVKITLLAVLKVLAIPKYFVLAFISVFAMAGVIVWSLNLDLLRYILFEAPISLYEKISFFSYTYRSLFTTFDSSQSLGIVVLSILFGINTAMFVYVIRRQGIKSVPKKSGGVAFTLAILGGGCVACGTSLLAPLLATFGATSSAFTRDLGAIFMWVGSVLTGYSIYKLSTLIRVKASNDNEEN